MMYCCLKPLITILLNAAWKISTQAQITGIHITLVAIQYSCE